MRKLLVALVVALSLGVSGAVAMATPPPGQGGNGGPTDNGNGGVPPGCQNPVPNVQNPNCVTPSPTPTTTPTETPSPTTSPEPSPSPSSTPSETPSTEPTPPVTTPVSTTQPSVCIPSVRFGPWYGDPRVNVTLTGPGAFVVRGGIQRFTGSRVIRLTLGCQQSEVIGRYKVKAGHTVRVYLNGTLLASQTAPAVKSL